MLVEMVSDPGGNEMEEPERLPEGPLSSVAVVESGLYSVTFFAAEAKVGAAKAWPSLFGDDRVPFDLIGVTKQELVNRKNAGMKILTLRNIRDPQLALAES